MGQITKEQMVEKEWGHDMIEVKQICTYDSIGEFVTIETSGQELCLTTDEWRYLFNLINKCLEMKGHSL